MKHRSSFMNLLTPDDCARINAGLKLWGPLFAKSQAIVKVKSDSVRYAVHSEASSSPLYNGIGPKIALVFELHNIEEIVTQHVPGKLNEVADKLSRLAQPGVSQQHRSEMMFSFNRGQLQSARRKLREYKFDRTTLAKQVVSQNNVIRLCSPMLLVAEPCAETPACVAEPCAETPACVVEPCAETPAQTFLFCTCFIKLTWWLIFEFLSFACTTSEVCCIPGNLAFPRCQFPSFPRLVLVQAAPQASRRGTWAALVTVHCSIWELRGDVPRWNEESPGLHLSWVVPLACPKNARNRPLQDCTSSENVQKTAQIAPESAREIGSRVRGCAATARSIARDPAARKAAQVKVRSKFYAKNVETTKSSKLTLHESSPLWAVVNLSIPSAGQRCSRSLARLIVQVIGRHRPTSLSCDYDMLSWTSRFHLRSTGPQESTML